MPINLKANLADYPHPDPIDELMADFIGATGALPSETNLIELMEWSYAQTQNPTEQQDKENEP